MGPPAGATCVRRRCRRQEPRPHAHPLPQVVRGVRPQQQQGVEEQGPQGCGQLCMMTVMPPTPARQQRRTRTTTATTTHSAELPAFCCHLYLKFTPPLCCKCKRCCILQTVKFESLLATRVCRSPACSLAHNLGTVGTNCQRYGQRRVGGWMGVNEKAAMRPICKVKG